MTTIAYKRGVMAADSRMCVNDWIMPGTLDKMFRLPDGGMAAVSGFHSGAMALIRWLQDGSAAADQPALDPGSFVYRVMPDKTLRIYEQGAFMDIDVPFAAWGSGSPVALAALHMGASPMEAVQTAAQFDPYTGGDIWEMSVK